MVVHAVLLFFGIGKQPLWQDEANLSLLWPAAPWSRVPELFTLNPEQHPLYYLVLRWWRIFGTSEAALRSLSAVFALASTPLIYLLGKRLASEWVARVSAVLLVFSPFFLFYGQEARMYSMLGFLALLSTLLVVLWYQTASRSALVGYVAAGILGAYTHFFFLYLLAAHTAAIVLWPRDARKTRAIRLISAQAIVGLAYLPWGIFLLQNLRASQDWKGAEHVLFGVPYTFLRFSVGFAEVLANYQWKSQIWELARQDALVLVPAILVFGLLTIQGLREAAKDGWNGVLVITGLGVPMAAALLTSVVTIVVGDRYFIVCYPFYVILLALGLRRLFNKRPSWQAWTVAVVLAGVTAKSLADYYFRDEFGKEQWREVAATIEEESGAQASVFIAPPPAATAFRYYFDPDGSADVVIAEWETFPPVAHLDSFWLVAAYTEDPDGVLQSFSATHRAVFRRLFPKESGIWLFRLVRNG